MSQIVDNCYPKLRGYWHSAELLAAAKFSEIGYLIAVPLVPCRYDFILDIGSGVLRRIQVKRAKFYEQRVKAVGKGDRAHYLIHLDRRKANSGKRRHIVLEDNEFDYLVVMCTAEDFYVLPASVVKGQVGKTKKTLMIKPPELAGDRVDSIASGARWEPYRNNFTIQ